MSQSETPSHRLLLAVWLRCIDHGCAEGHEGGLPQPGCGRCFEVVEGHCDVCLDVLPAAELKRVGRLTFCSKPECQPVDRAVIDVG